MSTSALKSLHTIHTHLESSRLPNNGLLARSAGEPDGCQKQQQRPVRAWARHMLAALACRNSDSMHSHADVQYSSTAVSQGVKRSPRACDADKPHPNRSAAATALLRLQKSLKPPPEGWRGPMKVGAKQHTARVGVAGQTCVANKPHT
jgi:hypothetical protein